MRFLIVLAVIIFAAFFAFNNFAPEIQRLEKSAEKNVVPFRYVFLLTKEPEAKIQIPVHGIRKKQIADTFGAARDGGARPHRGQDIFAPRGTPVFSATDGVVWHVGENALGGNTVWILGAGGRMYYYAHLEKYAPDLKTGDAVTPQTVLGFVGTSGNAKGTPPHLHFGVYSASGAQNPLPLFE